MNEEIVLPALSKDLIDKLDKLYPDKCPLLTDDDRMVWFKVGQRSVINYLQQIYDEQLQEYIKDYRENNQENMYKAQRNYYEKNKDELRKKARQKYHEKKIIDAVFTIRHGEYYPFREKECIDNINGMGATY